MFFSLFAFLKFQGFEGGVSQPPPPNIHKPNYHFVTVPKTDLKQLKFCCVALVQNFHWQKTVGVMNENPRDANVQKMKTILGN